VFLRKRKMEVKNIKVKWQRMLGDGRALNVLEEMVCYFQKQGEIEIISEVITLESRVKIADRQVGLGVITQEQGSVIVNNVVFSLTKIIAKLKDLPDQSQGLNPLKNLLNRIPISSAKFFGRNKELEQFNRAFSETSIITIQGLGGVGKTEFALACIQKFIPNKKNILWINPRTSFDIMVQQAGYGDILKLGLTDEFQKFKNLENLLDNDQKVLFFEDFHKNQDPTYIRFLKQLSIDTSRVIIITRYISDGLNPGLTIHLEGLGNHAIDFAFNIRNQNQSLKGIQDEDLYQLCNLVEGHPLSIELGIQLLNFGESSNSILKSISSENYIRHKKVDEFSQRLLLEVLDNENTSDEEKELLIRFSIYRHKVPLEAIEAIYDGSNLKFHLFLLFEKLLIRRQGDLYDSPPLIRELCISRLEQPEDIHKRAANYFRDQRSEEFEIGLEENIIYHLSKSQQWDELGQSITENGNLFIANGQILILRDIIESLNKNKIDQPVFNLFKAQIFLLENKFKLANEHIQKVLIFNNSNEITLVKTIALDVQGTIYEALSRQQDARISFLQCIEAAKSILDKKTEVTALTHLASLELGLGEIDSANEKAIEALKIAEEQRDEFGRTDVITLLGKINRLKKKFTLSLKYYQESYLIYHKLGAKINTANVANNIAVILYYLGIKNNDSSKHEEALLNFERCLVVERQIGSLSRMGVLYNNISKIQLFLGMYHDAHANFEKSLTLNQKINYEFGIASALHGIGLVKAKLGDEQEALLYFKRSLEKCYKCDYVPGIINVCLAIGQLYQDLEQPNPKLAIDWLIKALAYSLKMKADQSNILTQLDYLKTKYSNDSIEQYINTAVTNLPPTLQEYVINLKGIKYTRVKAAE